MEMKRILKRFWAGLDHLLLVAVFLLLGMAWYSAGRLDPQKGDAVGGRRPSAQVRRPSSPRVVNGLRVSAGHTRVNNIARSMVASGWEQIPSSPAMDMREDGKTYEILFSLPAGIDRDSVRVTAVGSVLTLAMKSSDTGKLHLHRVRIPCGAERPANIQSVVSNDVLRVHILPPGP